MAKPTRYAELQGVLLLFFLYTLTSKVSNRFTVIPGGIPCRDSLECAKMNLGGYTCQNFRCVCNPNTDTGLFPCRGKNIVLTAYLSSDRGPVCEVLRTDGCGNRGASPSGLATVLHLKIIILPLVLNGV